MINAILDSLTHEVIIPQGAHFFGNDYFSLVDGKAFIFIIWDTLIFPTVNSYTTPYSVKLAPDNITDVLSIFHQMPFVSIIKAKRCSHHAKLCLPENALIDIHVQNDFDLKVPPTNQIKIMSSQKTN